MKTKIIFSIFAACFLAATTLSFTGCNKEEVQPTSTSSIENVEFTPDEQEIITNLSNFNDQLLTHSESTTTKSVFWKRFVRVCRVASADISGAAVGGLSGGLVGGLIFFNPLGAAIGAGAGAITTSVAWSSKAYQKDIKENAIGTVSELPCNWNRIYSDPAYVYRTMASIPENKIQRAIAENETNVDFLNISDEYKRIGILHNLTIQKLAEAPEFPDTRIVNGDEDIATMVVNDYRFIADYRKSVNDAIYYLNQMDKVIDDNGISPNINFNTMTPVAREIYNMFNKLYIRYPSKMEDIDFIINYYATEIANSKALNETEKDGMYMALSVAAYSPRFWIKELGLAE